jgi:predicted XRE-type DNA-binding protein
MRSTLSKRNQPKGAASRRGTASASKLALQPQERLRGNRRVDSVAVTPGSNNVFADIGVPNADEALAKSGLVRSIGLVISRKHLTQRAVADLVGLPQPKVSGLLKGNTEGFSSDRLIQILLRLGYDVEINIRRSRSRLRRGKLTVFEAA